MECILLGTGGMMPMPYRMLTSMVVRLAGRTYLFDAGEGVQIPWKKLRLGLRGLQVLAVSHLHADHCLGIPGIMMLRAQMEDPEPLTILGPPGIEQFVRGVQASLGFLVNYPVSFLEWSESHGDLAYQDEQARIIWQPLQHTRFCLGYRFEELERPGKFNAGRAMALGVPKGPLWGRLQHGETITLDSGVAVTPDAVCGAPRRGRHVAYVVDTRPAKAIYRLCNKADIAFIEGMFLPEDSIHADNKGHLTVVDAARIARRAEASRAVLVHISPRYDEEAMPRLEMAARRQYAGVVMGRDLDVFPVALENEAP